MSPLWRDEVGIYLAPERILLVRIKRGLRPQRTTEKAVSVEPTGTHDWHQSLAALDAELSMPSWRGAVAHVVISDHWVRYAVLPATPTLKDVTEKLNYARHVFTDIYGDVVRDWRIVLADAPPAPTHIGSALPNDLVDRLQELLERHHLPLVSLQPQLVSSFNRWSQQLPAAGAWFITIEAGSLAAARLVPHGWDRVYTLRIGPDWQLDLRRLQKFGQLASTQPDESQVFIDAPATIRTAAQSYANALHWLDDEPATKVSTADQLHQLRRSHACRAHS